MRNLWLVAKHEYRRMVMRRAFLLITLAIPVGMAAIVGLVFIIEKSGQDRSPLGYVDYSGVVDGTGGLAQAASDEKGVEIRRYPNEEAGIAALERGDIQALFVLPASYPNALQTDLYYLAEPPNKDVWAEFDDLVRRSLLASYAEAVQTRLLEGPNVTVLDIASNREFSEAGMVNVILPFVATFFFFLATMLASGYMFNVVAEERENRTMEVMVTSVTPGQLIGGKALGLLAAALTQLGIYAAAAIVGLMIAAPHVEMLQQIAVPWTYLGIMALFFLPAFALISAIMIAVGSSVTDLEQGQQVAGFLNLLFMLPIFLLVLIFENPAHPVAVFFTLFPTTSFLTLSLRWGLGTVPLWQIGVSWVLLVLSAIATLWAAARIFRAGMLRYGQPLALQTALAAVRGGRR